jgi:FMN phosphatase YigB (HAD superfamily)
VRSNNFFSTLFLNDSIFCSDYNGAVAAGMKALLLRRPGLDGEQAHRHPQDQVDAVQTVKDLGEVIHWMKV